MDFRVGPAKTLVKTQAKDGGVVGKCFRQVEFGTPEFHITQRLAKVAFVNQDATDRGIGFDQPDALLGQCDGGPHPIGVTIIRKAWRVCGIQIGSHGIDTRFGR